MGDVRTIARFAALCAPPCGAILCSVAFDAVAVLVAASLPLLLRAVLDVAAPAGDAALLRTLAFAGATALFIAIALRASANILRAAIRQEAEASLAERTFLAIEGLPLDIHLRQRSGDLLRHITDDAPRAVGMIADILPNGLAAGLPVAIAIAISASVDLKLGFIALLILPLLILDACSLDRKGVRAAGKTSGSLASIRERARERLLGIATVKAYGQEHLEALSLGALLRRHCRIAVEGQLIDTFRASARSIAFGAWGALLLWHGGNCLLEGRLTGGWAVAIALYLVWMIPSLRTILALRDDWRERILSMRRLEDILSSGRGATAAAGDMAPGDHHTAAPLAFTEASGGNPPNGIDAAIPPSGITAIVGTDLGEASLAGFLQSSLSPADRMVLVRGEGVAEASVQAFRGRVGIVRQDAAIFDGTVIDNILYGNEGKERGDAMRAARLAGAHDFIERLPGGYDAPAGPSGSLLSAGQRQRIALARALLCDPAVVVLDEAPSSPDAESEFRIHEAIRALGKTKAVVVLARRLPTVRAADLVLVAEGGRVIERGTADELLEQRGAFFRCCCRQFGGLAAFFQRLDLELDRAARYGSAFCIAALAIGGMRPPPGEDDPSAWRRTESVELLLRARMRLGDCSAVLEEGLILLLLPEISARQLAQFFRRIQQSLPAAVAAGATGYSADAALAFAGTRITRKGPRTGEDLALAIATRARSQNAREAALIIPEDKLDPDAANDAADGAP